jgi:hypothetical protein
MIAEASTGALLLIPVLLLCLVPVGIAVLVFWICMLISAIQNKGLAEGEKIAWVLVIALLHVLGAIIYFFVGRPKRNTPLLKT